MDSVACEAAQCGSTSFLLALRCSVPETCVMGKVTLALATMVMSQVKVMLPSCLHSLVPGLSLVFNPVHGHVRRTCDVQCACSLRSKCSSSGPRTVSSCWMRPCYGLAASNIRLRWCHVLTSRDKRADAKLRMIENKAAQNTKTATILPSLKSRKPYRGASEEPYLQPLPTFRSAPYEGAAAKPKGFVALGKDSKTEPTERSECCRRRKQSENARARQVQADTRKLSKKRPYSEQTSWPCSNCAPSRPPTR